MSLLALARRCTESLALNAQKAYVTLLAEGEDLTVQGDQRLLEELCFNLCDNAIRYNRPGGRVILHVETRDGRPAPSGGGQRHWHSAGASGPCVRTLLSCG